MNINNANKGKIINQEMQQQRQNKIAQENIENLIGLYVEDINAAGNKEDAQSAMESLKSLLKKYGLTEDGLGIDNDLLKDSAKNVSASTTASAAGMTTDADGITHNLTEQQVDLAMSKAKDRAIVKEINKEFGIRQEEGNVYDWAQLAKERDDVRVLDKYNELSGRKAIQGVRVTDQNGEVVTDTIQGKILEVDSKKFGTVRIACGGDGNLNGSDDQVLSVGNQVALESVMNGIDKLNAITYMAKHGKANISGLAVNSTESVSETEAASIKNSALLYAANQNTDKLFSNAEMKNLLSAIMYTAYESIEHKEYKEEKDENLA